MKIIIDHRETTVIPLMEGLCSSYDPPLHHEITQLSLGDFLLIHDHCVLIERKSAADFISSIRSNRLWDQLLRFMKAETILQHPLKRKLLIIHGSFEQMEPGPSFWPQVMGAYMEILFVYDTPLILARTDDQFHECMRILINRELSGKNDLLPTPHWFRRHCSAHLPEMDRKRYVLSSLPSIGDVLAGNLLDHFGSLVAVVNASEKQLQRVEGIGEKKARVIYQLFHE
ncbi:MAG: helix-hairpin-helix domain-containing protein [Candidatus Thorarchaeota archaeon]